MNSPQKNHSIFQPTFGNRPEQYIGRGGTATTTRKRRGNLAVWKILYIFAGGICAGTGYWICYRLFFP